MQHQPQSRVRCPWISYPLIPGTDDGFPDEVTFYGESGPDPPSFENFIDPPQWEDCYDAPHQENYIDSPHWED